ncbi:MULTISPECIES: hypothetical protein [unclassified Streptomyces]|uniref:hypothetical protein n=1 Tax=unclassified Streptomyces TaxID=2593676 RepID=UPI0033D2E20F
MRTQVDSKHSDYVLIRAGADTPPVFTSEGVALNVGSGIEDGLGVGLTPAQAREAASALLRAANEAEGVHPSQAVHSARQHVRDTWVADAGREAFSAALDVLEQAVRDDVLRERNEER